MNGAKHTAIIICLHDRKQEGDHLEHSLTLRVTCIERQEEWVVMKKYNKMKQEQRLTAG